MIKKLISMLMPRASILKPNDSFYTRMVLTGAFSVTDKGHKIIRVSKVIEDKEGMAKLEKLVYDVKAIR